MKTSDKESSEKNGGVIASKSQGSNSRCNCGSGKKFKKCCQYKTVGVQSAATEPLKKPKLNMAVIAPILMLGEF